MIEILITIPRNYPHENYLLEKLKGAFDPNLHSFSFEESGSISSPRFESAKFDIEPMGLPAHDFGIGDFFLTYSEPN